MISHRYLKYLTWKSAFIILFSQYNIALACSNNVRIIDSDIDRAEEMKDHAAALEIAKFKASSGDKYSLYWLGNAYRSGAHVPKNDNISFFYFVEAALRGDKSAMTAVSEYFAKGISVKRNHIYAYVWMAVAFGDQQLENCQRVQTSYQELSSEMKVVARELAKRCRVSLMFPPYDCPRDNSEWPR